MHIIRFFRARQLTALLAGGLVGCLLAAGAAHAQIVNSGVSTTSSNSKVTLTATVPSIVLVNVDAATSVLSTHVDPTKINATANTVSSDFLIKGNVLVNSPSANVQCSVSTLSLNLVNGTDTITTKLTGTIGGTAINTSGFAPVMTSRQAAINITGDLDESTITSQKAPGAYSGTLTITASLL